MEDEGPVFDAEDDDGEEIDPYFNKDEAKTIRWAIVAVATVVVLCITGCTIGFVTRSHDFACTVNSNARMCDER